MTQPSDELRKAVWPLADLILIEADGARMMPCKVPAAYEPVILPETDTVLGVLGLDAERSQWRSRKEFRKARMDELLWEPERGDS